MAFGCYQKVVEYLVEQKADPKAKDAGGRSAADYAFSGEKPEDAAKLMTFLHDKGASINPRGDALGLLLAEGTRPDIDALLKKAEVEDQ